MASAFANHWLIPETSCIAIFSKNLRQEKELILALVLLFTLHVMAVQHCKRKV